MKILITTLLSIFLYVPYFNINGLLIFSGYISFFVPAILYFIVNQRINFNLALLFIYFIFFLIYSTLSFLGGDYFDARGVKLSLAIFFIASSTYAFYKFFLNKYNQIDFLKILFYALSVNVLIVVFCYISQDFVDVLYKIIEVNPKVFSYPVLRYPGIMYDGFSYLSTLNGIIVIIGVSIYYHDLSLRGFEKYIIILLSSLSFVAMFLTGRTGILVLIIGFLLLLVDLFKSGLIQRKSFVYKTFFLFNFILFFGFLVFFVFSFFGMDWYFDWAFNFLSAFLSGDGASSDSSLTELINNHYFVPGGLYALIFGVGDFNTLPFSSYSADPGYTILIHGSGVFGLFLYLSFVFLILLYSILNYFRAPVLSFLVIFISVVLIVVNFKDFYIFSPYTHYILYFMLLFKLFDSNDSSSSVLST